MTRRVVKQSTEYSRTKTVRYFLSQMIVVIVLLLLQFAILGLFFIAMFINSARSVVYAIVCIVCYLASAIVALVVINRKCNTAYKLAWVVPVLLFPGAGAALYLVVRGGSIHKLAKKRILKSRASFSEIPPPPLDAPFPADHPKARLKAYLDSIGFPTYDGTNALYLPTGEAFQKKLLEELEKAERFIFVEFFIIHEGDMWGDVLKILEKKAAEGVTVRVMYDGMGSLKTLPGNYPKKLKEKGIDAKVFSPFVPLISSTQNNRDHRKIVVIDGKVGFTGGINLSDEYINIYERFGHWKDSGICVSGKGAERLTRLFLELWYTNHTPDEHPEKFLAPYAEKAPGYIIPYADSPLFETEYIKNIYLELINGAKNYIYIITPYLVPGDDLLSALCRAARGGVDVRLITPFHGDKKTVHKISRSYYKQLLEAGVRVFEYSPGFIHSKTMVCDDIACSVGTCNLDYRSLYLHYECGVTAIDCPVVAEVKEDHLKTEALCHEMRVDELKEPRGFKALVFSVLRFFEPLV